MKKVILAAALMAVSASAQDVMWAPKGKPAQYRPPHKAHTKLADVKAKHDGAKTWRELVVDDQHLRSEWIFSPAGSNTPRMLHPDTRVWWVVWEGEVKFAIEKAGSFVARHGSVVQVPMQTWFSYETVGDRPSLIFETNIAGAKALYEDQNACSPPPGTEWMKVRLGNRPAGVYDKNNKPHVTFEEVAEAFESGKVRGTQRIVEDARGAANFIYGYNSKLPPLDPKAKGHYHPEGAEFWLILKGQIRYPIEGVGTIIANEGDVVYVPQYTFHFPRWWGEGPSCRLAMNGFPYIAHLFEPD